ncbi:MAG: tRNA 4-thiouridine(8) synthase ThiI [Firmicutes bacterium]|nr:tRNA 4-thiouridine(8) synthase ThiI [Bacillota bacterium]
MENKDIIIIRYGELHLKGKNRGVFERRLVENIRHTLHGIPHKLIVDRGRYEIVDYDKANEPRIIKQLSFVFGLHSFGVATACESNLDDIAKTACQCFSGRGSFKIETHRADKQFALTSLETSREIGGRVLLANRNATVDVHAPQTTIYVDIRETKKTYVYLGLQKGAGGLPYGTAGKGVAMLSGGIDSPVAMYMMGKRGLAMDAVHFWSYPYTSENAKQKVIDLHKNLQNFCPKSKLFVVPFTKIQETIHKACEPNYMITLIRRAMMRITQLLAQKMDAKCIVNGECLGQVASQTLDSMTVTNQVVSMPVLRPLIGFDKQEIIEVALKIGTYDTSILPYEDCCTIFMPPSPVTKPYLDRCVQNEQKIVDYDQLILDAANNTQMV